MCSGLLLLRFLQTRVRSSRTMDDTPFVKRRMPRNNKPISRRFHEMSIQCCVFYDKISGLPTSVVRRIVCLGPHASPFRGALITFLLPRHWNGSRPWNRIVIERFSWSDCRGWNSFPSIRNFFVAVKYKHFFNCDVFLATEFLDYLIRNELFLIPPLVERVLHVY